MTNNQKIAFAGLSIFALGLIISNSKLLKDLRTMRNLHKQDEAMVDRARQIIFDAKFKGVVADNFDT